MGEDVVGEKGRYGWAVVQHGFQNCAHLGEEGRKEDIRLSWKGHL